MLAKEASKPFNGKDWLFEIKWDGYRAIAALNKEDVQLYSRNGNSFLSSYPLVVNELRKMKLNAVLDGEIVVLNEEGNPDFQKLAESFGAHGHTVMTAEDFKPTLDSALATPGVHVIALPIDYSENEKVFGKSAEPE